MRFLLVQLKRIGDLVLTTPAIVCLREKFPDAEIVLAVEKSAAGLLPLVDHDEAIVFDRKSPSLRPWLAVRKKKFDACFDFTGNDRAATVCAVARALKKIAWKRFAGKVLRRAIFTHFVDSSVALRHTADHHIDLLKAVGIERQGVDSHLVVPPGAGAAAKGKLEESGVAGAFVAVHPGTARTEKYWVPQRWAGVIRHLVEEEKRTVVITGSGAEEEKRHLAEIRNFLGDDLSGRVPDLLGKLDLAELAAVFCRSSLVCGVDSAPLHFSDALRVPAIALFGPTDPLHWKPRATTSRIVVPFGGKGGRMEEISEEQVLAALRSMPGEFR